ncbi:hypothetical protein [Staphylococcus succinus]|nr:hypothetical protein [Staphylococcus succinus]
MNSKWESIKLKEKRRNIDVRKAKHSKKGYKHRARLLANKML